MLCTSGTRIVELNYIDSVLCTLEAGLFFANPTVLMRGEMSCCVINNLVLRLGASVSSVMHFFRGELSAVDVKYSKSIPFHTTAL